MRHHATPCKSLLPPLSTPRLTKGNQTLLLTPGLQPAHTCLSALPLFFQLFSLLSRKLNDPKNHCRFPAFEMPSKNTCPKPKLLKFSVYFLVYFITLLWTLLLSFHLHLSTAHITTAKTYIIVFHCLFQGYIWGFTCCFL